MGIRLPNSTNYIHPDESNLLELHRAMEYDGQGKPVFRTAVSGATAITAFDEPVSITLTPVIQLDSVYEIYPGATQTYTSGGGSVVIDDDARWDISSGTTLGSFGVFRSRRHLRYRAGQGGVARFTALFEGGVTGTTMRVGLANQESSISIGVNNGQFGILKSYDGRAEVRTLTISGTSASGTATIVLNGTSFNVTLVAGETATQTAARIARATFTGWLVEAKDEDVRFLSEQTASLDGVYSYTGAGGTTGSFARSQAGRAITEEWTYQSDFNHDRLDGTGASNITIDPTKMNVFQIQYRWLGAGIVRFAMENPLTGQMMVFHEIHYVNQNTKPWTHNPNFKVTYVAYNIGADTACTVKGSSLMAAIEGEITKNDYPRSFSTKKSGLASNTIHHLFSVRNPRTLEGKINTRELVLQDLSLAVQGNDPVEIMLFYDASLATGNHVYVRQADDIANISTVTGTFSLANDTPVVTFITGINGSAQYELQDYRIVVPGGDAVSVAIRSGQSVSQVAAALVWVAD